MSMRKGNAMILIEMKRGFKNIFLWILIAFFLVFNFLSIFENYAENDKKNEMSFMHSVMTGTGSSSAKDNQQKDEIALYSEVEKAYIDYKEQFSTLYDNLDMMKILKIKEAKTGYKPQGEYKNFIEKNYKKLQKRVEQIKKTNEYEGNFYPGNIYKTHGFLYGKLKRSLMIQTAIIMMLSVFYLLDYERINKTRDIVLASKRGRKVAIDKAVAGIMVGIIDSMLLMTLTYVYYFINVPYKNLWNTAVSAVVMAESRMQMTYPFITFWDMTERKYFIATVIVMILFIIAVGLCSVGIWFIFENSYFSFIFQCIIYLLMMTIITYSWCNFFDVIRLLINPVTLYCTGGGWFMENDMALSFANNEFYCLMVLFFEMGVLSATGYCKYRRRDK
ncbi:MAG: hypothetical protein E7254_01395 [Lachnospiraceae bacterium]|nr:hypothetical protein [Lachnospiraceae bacterium]